MKSNLSDSTYQRNAILLIVGALIFRALYPLLFPVNLAGDEAYYWDWGRRPALCYFSKPPMIAWIYAVVDRVAGASLFSIRLTAVLFGTVSLFITYLLTKRLFDARTAFIAVVIALSIPGNCVLNYFLTIDAPLVVSWSLSLLFLWNYAKGKSPGLSLFLLFLSIGAGMLSKQMMLAFPPLALAFLAASQETRPLLKRPGAWLALIGSYLFLIPPLYWNSQNEWITFNHMSTHVGGKSEPTIWATLYERVETFFEFFGSQLGALSPVTAVLLFLLTFCALFSYRVLPKLTLRGKFPFIEIAPTSELRGSFVFFFCGAPLALILIAAMFQKIQPNWPAVLYLAGVPMVAAWFSKAIDWYPVADKTRKGFYLGAIIPGFLLCAFFYLSPIIFGLFGAEGHKADPNRRLIGGKAFGEQVQEVRKNIPGWEDALVATAGHRYNASYLAFWLPDRPRVYSLFKTHKVSQYEVWPSAFEDNGKGKNGVIVQQGHVDKPHAWVTKAFESVEAIDQISVQYGGGVGTYTIFHAKNMQGPIAAEKTE